MPKARRGEVWQIDLGMAGKVRPAVVISVEFTDSERALYTLVAHTTSARGTRFEVALDIPSLQPGVFDVQELVTLPDPKLLRRRDILTADQIRRIEEALSLWLGYTSEGNFSAPKNPAPNPFRGRRAVDRRLHDGAARFTRQTLRTAFIPNPFRGACLSSARLRVLRRGPCG